MFRRKPKVEKLSDWHRIKSRHARGSHVWVIVIRAVGLGLLCRLQGDDKALGVVRNREISWMKGAQDAFAYNSGDHFEALVVGYDDLNRQLLLSKKRADLDPVKIFPVRLQMECEIAERHTWGYQVHLRGGVDGDLYKEDTPSQDHLPPSARLQQGDRLLLEVIGHDSETQAPKLSLKNTIKQHQTSIEAQIQKLDPQHYFAKSAPVALVTPCSRTLSILLVDDEPEVLATVAPLLSKAGHRVSQVSTSAEVHEWLRASDESDVVLLDLQLRGESLRTPKLPMAILRRYPHARIYLFTGNEELLNRHDAFNLRDHIEGLIPKGDAELLLSIIEEREEALSLDSLTSTENSRTPSKIKGTNPTAIIQSAVQRHLPELASIWPHAAILVAEYNRELNAGMPLAAVRFPVEEMKKRSQAFLNCELGSVLTDGGALQLSIADEPSPEARDWMKSVASARVIGRSIQVGGYPKNLGVYFFIGKEVVVTQEELAEQLQPKIASLLLDIERSVLHHKILTFQRAASTGSLVLGMTHELKNLLLPIDARLLTFLTDVDAVARGKSAKTPDELMAAGGRLRGSIKSLTTMMEGFLRMTRRDADKLLPLDVILREVVGLCADSGRQFDVFIAPLTNELAEAEIPMVSSQVRQVFMNIILNAIQHCHQTQSISHKLVTTQLSNPSDKRLQGVVVRITDNGYGIAASGRQQIFDMFYTTRPDGSGLGLYVAKDIIESLGGRIWVEHQARYRENTLCVFIPSKKPMQSSP